LIFDKAASVFRHLVSGQLLNRKAMTVAGLVEALLKMPGNAVVLMENGGGLSLVAGLDFIEEQGAGAPAEVILLPSMNE
jgi:hypothetical protein